VNRSTGSIKQQEQQSPADAGLFFARDIAFARIYCPKDRLELNI
jgi:hypothetical protein